MKRIKAVFAALPKYILWFLFSVLLWVWIFGRITDAPAEKKVSLYIDSPDVSSRTLQLRLEENMPEEIRLISVHPFSYVMFDDAELLSADLYIVPESSAEEYMSSFGSAAAFAEVHPGYEYLTVDGLPCGIRVYSPDDPSSAVAADCIEYPEGENAYLFFGKDSLHTRDLNGSADNAAVETAVRLLEMNGGNE